MEPQINTPVSFRPSEFEIKMLSDLREFFNENKSKIIRRAIYFLWLTHCKEQTK